MQVTRTCAGQEVAAQAPLRRRRAATVSPVPLPHRASSHSHPLVDCQPGLMKCDGRRTELTCYSRRTLDLGLGGSMMGLLQRMLEAAKSQEAIPEPALPPTRHEEEGSNRSGLELVKAEYETLRNESLWSLRSQQEVVRWGLAAYGVVLAAGLVLVERIPDATGQNEIILSSLAMLVFGLALPGLTLSACVAWLGELKRMERVGYYLRGLEAELRRVARWNVLGVQAPLCWESFIAFGERGKSRPKSKLAYAGQAGTYLVQIGIALLGLAILAQSSVFAAKGHWYSDLLPGLAYAWSLLVVLAFLVLMVSQSWLLGRLSKQVLDRRDMQWENMSRPPRRAWSRIGLARPRQPRGQSSMTEANDAVSSVSLESANDAAAGH